MDSETGDQPFLKRALEKGMRAAFGMTSPGGHGVLQVIRARIGREPRVRLHEVPAEVEAGPAIDPRSPEARMSPQGGSKYQILGEVARGGMGVILQGHDTDLGRDVALKILLQEHSDNAAVIERFVEEAQIGGQLQHPGIVPVYELGLLSDDRPYFAMKLVKGRTLSELLLERASPAQDRQRFLSIFEDICQAMAYAHSHGVIHRDLKPANIMVGAFGELQILDWGLAKVVQRDPAAGQKPATDDKITTIQTVRSEPDSKTFKSSAGSVMGTLAYMPPEQARGSVDALDPSSDVFSLGAVLCELLTGSPPYVGEPETLHQRVASAELEECYARLDSCGADDELTALARRCLMPARGARPLSAQPLVDAIHRHRVSIEDRARQAELAAAEARVKAQAERRARKLTLGLAVSVLVTALVVAFAWLKSQQDRTERVRRNSEGAYAALSEAGLLRAKGQWEEALGALQRARVHVEADEADSALEHRVEQVLSEIRSERDNQALIASLDRGVLAPSIPVDNPMTVEKVELGKLLFFDPRLSRDGTVSCATCHDPKTGWTDRRSTSVGIDGSRGRRNALTIINAAYQRTLFWDGRTASLEEQALHPVEDPSEMGHDVEAVLATLGGIPGYRRRFEAVFGTEVTRQSMGRALAAFERTILSAMDSPYDRYQAGDVDALTEAQKRGMFVFKEKADCARCHAGPTFSDGAYYNAGVGTEHPDPDPGRMAVTGSERDSGRFRVPSLRNLTDTGPYFHDGSAETLESAVELMAGGGVDNPNLHFRFESIREADIGEQERLDLVEFIRALSSDYPVVEPPRLPTGE